MTVRIQANPDNSDIDRAVKAKYTEKFRANLPITVEACLRLTLERLHRGLKADKPISNPELACLAGAANQLYDIYSNLHNEI